MIKRQARERWLDRSRTPRVPKSGKVIVATVQQTLSKVESRLGEPRWAEDWIRWRHAFGTVQHLVPRRVRRAGPVGGNVGRLPYRRPERCEMLYRPALQRVHIVDVER